MRFISVRDLRTRPAEIWRALRDKGELVITSNGKPIAILSDVDEDRLEETLSAIRRARAIEAVTRIQKRSLATGTHRITDDEIAREINEVRQARRE